MTAGAEEQDRLDMGRLAAGHDAALEALMGRHAEPLFHYLSRLLQNEPEAADLAQEAFVRVYQNRLRFKPSGKFSSWLYAIATNLARDTQRYRARHPHVSLEAERADTGSDLRATLPSAAPGPVELLETTERVEAVRSAVAALPEDLRAPLILAVYEDKPVAEIAQILGCTPKAAEMRLYRARQELRAGLAKLMAAL